MYHVVFLQNDPLDDILAGRNAGSCGCRRRLAYCSVEIGDRLLLRRTGGDIEAVATVGQVNRYDTTQRATFMRHARNAAARAHIDQKFALGAKYSAAIRLDRVRSISFSPVLTPRNVREGWVADFDIGAVLID